MSPEQVTVEQHEEWLQEPAESELPARPRRRLLGVGGNPIPRALIGVLLIACGFIGGVLVEKGQGSSSGGASGLASRFAALRGSLGAGAGGSAGGGASFGRGSSGGSAGGLFGGASAGGATVGQVAYISGDTLYVTNSEGATIKVRASAASTVTKTVKADVKSIHPGETVIVTGSAGANGAISAESIRVSEAGALGGGLGALFGGGGSGAGSSVTRGSSSGAGAGGGEQALFGK